MTSIFLQSYLFIFLSIGLVALLIFMVGIYLIFRRPPTKSIATTKIVSPKVSEMSFKAEPGMKSAAMLSDYSAIAGNDVIATQLDLARAYLETGNKSLAEQILVTVIEQGNAQEQQEAQQLLLQ